MSTVDSRGLVPTNAQLLAQVPSGPPARPRPQALCPLLELLLGESRGPERYPE